MGSRNKQHLLWVLATMPWWVSLVLAATVYVAVRWMFPAMAGQRALLKDIAEGLRNYAGLFATPFLAVAVFVAFKGFYRRRLLDEQTDVESLKATSWQDFELLVGEAFRRQGFTVEEAGGAGPDGGVDLVLFRSGKKTVVQCKRWKNAQVGVNLVRELYGVMVAERADRCVFVSSGVFTADAIAFAKENPIELIDGRSLADLFKTVQSAGKGLASQPRIPDRIPACPICRDAMVRRVAKRGAQAGSEFWGCPRFPMCRGTRDV